MNAMLEDLGILIVYCYNNLQQLNLLSSIMNMKNIRFYNCYWSKVWSDLSKKSILHFFNIYTLAQ